MALCDGIIFIMTVESLTVLGVAKLTRVTAFSINNHPTVDDPLRVEVFS